MSWKLHRRPSADNFQTSSRRHSIQTVRAALSTTFFLSDAHGRCRRGSLTRIGSRQSFEHRRSRLERWRDRRTQRDLSIETRTRRQGGPVARAMGVSLPRSRGPPPIPSFLLSDYSRFFSISSNLRVVSSSSCRRKLELTKFFTSAAVEFCWSFQTSSQSTKFKDFIVSILDERIDPRPRGRSRSFSLRRR